MYLETERKLSFFSYMLYPMPLFILLFVIYFIFNQLMCFPELCELYYKTYQTPEGGHMNPIYSQCIRNSDAKT
jgi:hypothetical protein